MLRLILSLKLSSCKNKGCNPAIKYIHVQCRDLVATKSEKLRASRAHGKQNGTEDMSRRDGC